jgi:predicted acyl esterase
MLPATISAFCVMPRVSTARRIAKIVLAIACGTPCVIFSHAMLLAAPEPLVEFATMRDGVRLATTVYVPDSEQSGAGPWPCVLSRTPYGQGGLLPFSTQYNRRGFVFVTQDCRGKGRSEGKYEPFRTDHVDGYDTIEWIAAQTWSNGKVGMLGASALGIATNLAATQVPPHLVCAYVVVTPASARRNTVYTGGIYRKEMNDGWLRGQGVPEISDEQVRHPPGSSYWDWRELRDFHSRIRIPIYQVGGWFDVFSQGAIDNFVGLQAHGSGLAAGNQRLVIGPWGHGNLDGRLTFPDASVYGYLAGEEQFRWFARWLQGKENGVGEEPPVRYYVLGDPTDPNALGNEWRTATSWPPPSRPASYFLGPRRNLVREPSRYDHAIAYVYDPTLPVPTVGGANLIQGGRGPVDQRSIPERQDYTRFTTPPLEHPVEIAGQVFVDLWIESDARDTDFIAKLVDVYPDGYEALITDGGLRARYRQGLDREVFLEPGRVERIRIDLWSTAIIFHRGHRIGLHITSSNDPKLDPNPNTGAPLRSNGETRPAKNTIHLGHSKPSRLLLPVVRVHSEGEAPDGGTEATKER